MEKEQIDKIKNSELMNHIKDYLELSQATEIVVTKVADDNWTIVATVPTPGGE